MKTKDDIQTEALRIILPLKRAGVAISMGAGKSLLGLKHMVENYSDHCKFLVVAPKLEIFQSWKDDAKKFNLEYLLDHIHFSTYLSLSKEDLDYDVVYLDECHNLLYSHEPWLSAYNSKILGLTGTAPKYQHSEKGKMVSTYCPIVYEYTTDEAVEDKILNDYKIVVHGLFLDTAKNVIAGKGDRTWLTSEKASYDYWTKRLSDANSPKQTQILRVMRMNSLKNAKSKERYAKKLFEASKEKCILFANTQEQAEKLCTHSFHSKNPDSKENLRKFKAGEINKLSCVLQLSEGINIPNLKEGIILHCYSGSSPKGRQRLGRCLRLNPDETATIHILMFRDTVDEVWVKEALEIVDPSKITWINGDMVK